MTRHEPLVLLALLDAATAAEARSNQARQAPFRGSHEALRARRGPAWGVSLCGPMVIDDQTRTRATRQPEPDGRPPLPGLVDGLHPPVPRSVCSSSPSHDVDFDVLRRTAEHADIRLLRYYARRQWPATRRQERRCGEAVDLLLATSARDRGVFERELELRRVAVVPNAIDLAEFVPSSRAAVPDTILFSGLMSYYPNQQAIRWFVKEVFPAVLRNQPAHGWSWRALPLRAGCPRSRDPGSRSPASCRTSDRILRARPWSSLRC